MEKNLFDVKGKVVVMTGACGVLGSTIELNILQPRDVRWFCSTLRGLPLSARRW